LKKCADAIIPYLTQIFRAVFSLRVYAKQWSEIITCVLQKPGKPRYDVPKAYRPIALLNSIPKLLTSIIAEEVTHLTEWHQLLPATHFGGRPRHTTTDSLHLLTNTIKTAWHCKQVILVLFLDIKGAFPNAVTSRLRHNMRKRTVPEAYILFVENMLTRQKTKLRFDNYTSDWFEIDNGIGQGDPLSMILYLFYNADVLDIARGPNEKSLGYVDDKALVAIGKTFEKTHRMLGRMMRRQNGGFTWSKSHNSNFETSKLILMDFLRSQTELRPLLMLRGIPIYPQLTHKFIGVILDQELRWNQQGDHAVAKAAKWTLAFRRLTRPSMGIRPKLLRQLHNTVAVPKLSYAADVWYTPMHKIEGKTNKSGSVRVTCKLITIQRMATLAITGALKSMATDVLDLHANILPVELLLHKICHCTALRIATLPPSHPLHTPF
jgi:hypothetical protein